MSIRKRDDRWIVEIYDPELGRKRHVPPSDHGVSQPRNRSEAKELERLALNALKQGGKQVGHQTCAGFADRWPREYVNGRGESTLLHNAERVRRFGREFGDRALGSVTREDARLFAQEHPGAVSALRAMFNDAASSGLVDANPFAQLRIARSRGREDITVLTVDEVHALSAIAREVHGPGFGDDVAAFIIWQAYTCMRTGEVFAARYSNLEGDLYAVIEQYNSKLGKYTQPKYGSTGTIFVPEPARQAVFKKPRLITDDLMFHGKRGQILRQESWSRAWAPVRSAFMESLPRTHHLWQRFEGDTLKRFDSYELRHFGASHMLNDLKIEAWVIAKQLRHSDEGQLVIKLYGHPSREDAIDQVRSAYRNDKVVELRGTAGSAQLPRRGSLGGAS